MDHYGPEFQPSEDEVDARIQAEFEAGMVDVMAACERLAQRDGARLRGPDDV